ncbi:MAG: hypothetical protein EOS76_18590, partial [Mesorhizobium sp.]
MAVLEEGPVEEGTVRHRCLRCASIVELHGAPLCPAGHLPHKGGDWQLGRRRHPCNVENWRKRTRRLISPQVGEMS